MPTNTEIISRLRRELEETQNSLREAEDVLNAIRQGDVDGLVISGAETPQVYTLKGAQEPYRLLIEQMSEGALTVSREGTVLFANQTFARLTQTPLENVIGAHVSDLVISEEIPAMQHLVEAGWNGTTHGIVTFRTSDGSVIPLHLGISSLNLETEKLLCIVATDLTEISKIEKLMQRVDPQLKAKVAVESRVAGIAVILIGLTVMIGWMLNIRVLQSIFPYTISMKFNTALCLVLTGFSLFVRQLPRQDSIKSYLAIIPAVMVFIISALTLSQDISGWDLKIDQLVFQDLNPPGTSTAGRMSPLTAISFLLVTIALLFFNKNNNKSEITAQGCAGLVVLISLFSLIGYVYEIESFYNISGFVPMAIHTTVSFILLSFGILFSDPDRSILAVIVRGSPGGLLTRRLLPVAFLVPFCLGWLRLKGQQLNLYQTEFGVSLFVMVIILCFTGFILWVAIPMDQRDARRRLIEGKLHSSEKQYSDILNSAMDAIITINANRRIILFNAAAENIFRCSFEYAHGKPIEQFIPEPFQNDRRQKVTEFTHLHTENGKVELFNSAGRRGDGEHFPLEASISRTETDGREFFTIILRDITERIRAREMDFRLSAIVESSNDAIISRDFEGTIQSWNKAAENIFGYRAEEIIGQNVAVLYPPELPALERENLERIKQGERFSNVETINIKKDGTSFPVSLSYSPVKNAEGRVFAISKIIRDLTERKQVEGALFESEERLRMTVEATKLGIWEIDLLTEKCFWSAHSKTILGFSAHAEMTKEKIYGCVDPKDLSLLKNIVKGAPPVNDTGKFKVEFRIFNNQIGDVQWIESKGQVFFEAGRAVRALGTLMNITERKHAEDNIRHLNQTLELRVAKRTAELEAANQELEAFSYSVSHDLRAPLRHINGFSQALMEDCARDLSAEGKQYLKQLCDASIEMGKLIDDLLQLARVSRNEMKIDTVNLTQAADEITAEFKKLDAARKVTVNVERNLASDGDPGLLQIVLRNLLGNAWKFTSKRDHAEITFGQKKDNGENVYFIRDNGAGFDMNYSDKLFGTFQRLHTSSDFEGTGIGLATVRRIINRHGGRVWAEGATDQGAVFYFTIPDKKEHLNEE